MSNNQVLGAGEGEYHKIAKEYLYNFFNKCDKDVKITWKDKGKIRCCTIKNNVFHGADIEEDIVCQNKKSSIRPDVILYKFGKTNQYKIPLFFLEVDVTNPVDENKKKKIRWLKENKYPNLRVFELSHDMVAQLSRNVNESAQYGGGLYYSLCIEREIDD
jgi:hypothetical protein